MSAEHLVPRRRQGSRRNSQARCLRYILQFEIFWALDQVQQVAFKVGKEQHAPATSGRPDFFAEFHAAFFQFGPGRVNRSHTQRDMTKSGEFVIVTVIWYAFGSINFKPSAARQREQARRRGLTVVENFARAQNARIPVFQRQWIACGDGNVFDAKIHAGIKNQKTESKN